MKLARMLPGWIFFLIVQVCSCLALVAQQAEPTTSADTATANAAAAAVATGQAPAGAPEFIEHLVDAVLEAFNVRSNANTPTRYVISALFLVSAFLLRRIVVTIGFGILKRFAKKTETTLDDELFQALETPVASLVVVLGGVSAFKVLKLSPSADSALGYAYTVAFSFVLFWILLRSFNTIIDHIQRVTLAKGLAIAAFMPWIKKTLLAVFVTFGVLMIAQSLGADVKAFLAGLGIGGLAFALAAQDTLANVFGSVVVATDQPFKLGEFVRIGSFLGGVEDIGLRSTRLRALDKSLVTIPNKTVASETVVNLSRFTQRRAEQVIGLTYDTTPEQMEAVVEEFRQLILKEDYVDPTSVMVYFRDFSACSLDIWVVYVTKDGDFQKHMRLRQKLNTEMMKIVKARGLSFAFPTQTVVLDGPLAKQLLAGKS